MERNYCNASWTKTYFTSWNLPKFRTQKRSQRVLIPFCTVRYSNITTVSLQHSGPQADDPV
jgi:hypothetical protein